MFYNLLKLTLIFSIISLFGCEKTRFTSSVSAGVAREFYTFTNDTEEYLINVQDIEQLEVVVEAETDKGSMTLSMFTPTGNKYWQHTISGDDEVYTDVVVETPINGNWKLTVKIVDAIGEYGLSWEGN